MVPASAVCDLMRARAPAAHRLTSEFSAGLSALRAGRERPRPRPTRYSQALRRQACVRRSWRRGGPRSARERRLTRYSQALRRQALRTSLLASRRASVSAGTAADPIFSSAAAASLRTLLLASRRASVSAGTAAAAAEPMSRRAAAASLHVALGIAEELGQRGNDQEWCDVSHAHQLPYGMISLWRMIPDQVNQMQNATMIRVVEFHRP